MDGWWKCQDLNNIIQQSSISTKMLEVREEVGFFNKNFKDIGTRIPFLKYMQKYCNVNILLVAYRGYSYSEGVPTESGIQRDAHVLFYFWSKLTRQAVLDYIFSRTDLDTEKIFIFGRSLGGAVGIYGLSHGDHKVIALGDWDSLTSSK